MFWLSGWLCYVFVLGCVMCLCFVCVVCSLLVCVMCPFFYVLCEVVSLCYVKCLGECLNVLVSKCLGI